MLRMTFTRPDRTARAELQRLGAERFRVVGHVRGFALGRDGQGREYNGPEARDQALGFCVELVYGHRMRRLGAA